MGFLSASHCPPQHIPCDFGLYANATNLSQNQKLLPNEDITGAKITEAFIITGFLALGCAVLILIDEFHLLQLERKGTTSSMRDSEFYTRAIHTIDTLLHGFSDSQLVAGISLLSATYFQGCDISAYHYNLICLMVIMSLITHIFAFVNIPHFFKKNWSPALLRLAGVIATLGLAWALFKSREVNNFPTSPGSLSIMPAHCFTTNTSVTDTDFFTSDNASSIFLGDGDNGAAHQYNFMFLPVAVLMIIGFIFLVADSFSDWLHSWFVFGIRGLITIVALAVACYITYQLNSLRSGMEVEKWYVVDKKNAYSYSQIVSMTLLASTAIPVLKALQETIDGPRGKPSKLLDNAGWMGTELKDGQADGFANFGA